MKLRVEYSVEVEVEEDVAPQVEKALNATAKKFDQNASVLESDCEELEDDEDNEA